MGRYWWMDVVCPCGVCAGVSGACVFSDMCTHAFIHGYDNFVGRFH